MYSLQGIILKSGSEFCQFSICSHIQYSLVSNSKFPFSNGTQQLSESNRVAKRDPLWVYITEGFTVLPNHVTGSASFDPCSEGRHAILFSPVLTDYFSFTRSEIQLLVLTLYPEIMIPFYISPFINIYREVIFLIIIP